MPFVLRPPTEAVSLPDRLDDLGRTRRRVRVAAGLFRLVAVVSFSVMVWTIADTFWHLPGVLRAVGLAGVLALGGVAFLRWVRAPLREPCHPRAVARLLEERFPRLNDALASAVDFLQAANRPGSPRFQSVAVKRAENIADRCRLDVIVPMGRMWKDFWLAACTLIVAGPLSLISPTTSAQAMLRLFDPYGSHPWPTATTIEVLLPKPDADRPLRIAKGSAFPLHFAVRGVIPDQATISWRLDDTVVTEEPIPLLQPEGESLSEVVVEHVVESSRVPRDFDYRIVANDFDTGWQSVLVSPVPKLVPLDGLPSPQITLTYRPYTDLPPAMLPAGTGVVEAVTGTRVRFRAAVDRRVVSARFHNQTDLSTLKAATAVACLSSDNPLSAIGAQLLADSATSDIPLTISADGLRLDADFCPTLAGLYALELTDEYGLTSTQLFDFRITPDPVPSVILNRPTPKLDALHLLPGAILTVNAHAEDRLFASRSLHLEYRFGGPDTPLLALRLVDLPQVQTRLAAVAGAGASAVPLKPVDLDSISRIPLARLVKQNGEPPKDGDVILLRAAAHDWDDWTAMKPAGRSAEIEIHVLSRPSLEANFQKELADLRPDLLRLKEDQRQAREKTEEVARAAQAGRPLPETPSKLAQALQAQRTIQNKVADPTEGLRARVERLRQAVQANALSRSPTTDKVEAVANELAQLARQPLEAAPPLLEGARQELAQAQAEEHAKANIARMAELTTRATEQQRDAEKRLAAVLERLEQWGGAGEIRGEARSVKEQLNRLNELVEQATKSIPAGRSRAALTEAETAKLAAPAARLDQLAEQAAGLLNKANRLASDKAEQANDHRAAAGQKQEEAAAATDPKQAAQLATEAAARNQSATRAEAEAEALRQAVRDAGGQLLPNELRQAANALRGNQTVESSKLRQSAANRLDQLANPLAEPPQESAAELSKKRDDLAAQLDDLAEAQDLLRKKARDAAKNPDPVQREEQLQKLAREQEQLRERTEQLLQRLTRQREPDQPAAEALRRAAEKMAASRDEMEQGRLQREQTDQALDQLDQALEQLEQKQEQAEEQLSKEKREQLIDQIKAFRERQQAALTEAGRLQSALLQAKRWSRALLATAGDLEERESTIAAELRDFAGMELTHLPVFGKLVEQSAAAIEKAARHARQRVEDTDPVEPFDAENEAVNQLRVERPMRLALRKLDQILQAVENEKPKDTPQPMAGNTDNPKPPEQEGTMPPGESDGIPALAQLKALRAMQADVNEQTARFAKNHPAGAKLTGDEKEEIAELEQAQRDVAELFEKLAETLLQNQEMP